MKFTAIILLSACLTASAIGNSQSITLDVKDAPLEKVFKEIKKQSGYSFVYAKDLLQKGKTVTLQLRNANVDEALQQIFKDQPFTYKIISTVVTVNTKDSKAIISNEQSIIETVAPLPITGKVTDNNGIPLQGVTVMVKGTSVGTTTDANGNYSINVPESSSNIIAFTFIGRESAEMNVKGKTVVNVILKNAFQEGKDLVIVGYGIQKKASLTSAITSVNTDLIESRSMIKLSTGLQGLAPGVNIRQQTGRPGFAASTFDIRGASLGTFSSNPPLVLIDGIVDDINNINPEDVDKISILKDAAAAAIYGSRSTGGVVLITTKRGGSGAPSVNYSSVVGFQQRPYGNYKFLNTADWMRANNEAAHLDGSPDIYADADIAKYDNSTDPQYPITSQWKDWIEKSAWQQNHNINIKGGTEKLNFYASAGYVLQDGFVANDDYERKSLLLNLNYKPGSRFEFNTSISYINEDITRPALGIGDVNDILRNALMTVPTTPFRLPNGDYNNATMWGNNPAYLIESGGNGIYKNDLLRMGLTAKYKIAEGLSLRYTTAANINFFSGNNIDKKIPFKDNDGVIYKYNRADVRVSETWSKSVYLNNQLMLDYDKQWKNHTLAVMGGVTSEDQRTDNISAGATQFPNNEIREISGTTGTGNQISGSSSATDWAIASVIGRLRYGFKDKYLLESSLRYDGSSRFSPEKRWGLFPSVSVGWRIIKENFLKDIYFLSDLKLRASWGQLGNQGTSLYPFAQNVTTSGRYAFGNQLVAVAALGSPVNLALTWEKKKTINFGVDYGFLKNRLSGSFDYFSDRTSGIIGRPTVPSTFGASAPIQNTYIINNRGFEFEIKWNDKIGKLKYFAGFNLSDSRDKVISLGGIGTTDPRFGNGLVQLSNSSYLHEGEARNHFYLYKTDGLFVDQAEINKHAVISTLTRPGDISFTDVNGDGKLSPDDKVPDKRTSTPHYFFGFNLGAEYQSFDLSVVINGVGQRWDFRNNGGIYLSGVRTTLAMLEDNYNNRWTEANPNKHADQTRLTNNNWIANDYSTQFGAPNDYHLRNFKYLRVRNIQLGYTLPTGIANRIYMSKLRIYTTLENAFTFSPGYKERIDPESIMNYTPDGSAYFGQPRVISFGLSVTFK